ncbi:MAG: hypothetical protein JJU16_07445 [Alkalibacterium sp.]|nr:hypothetical protein [Alkalibacterium sp.]
MTKKLMVLPIALLGLGLAACQTDEEEAAVIETEEVASETEGDDSETNEQTVEEQNEEEIEETGDDEEELVFDQTEKYQNLLDQAKREYEAEELDAAAGTLSVLLQHDLTGYPEIMAEGESLKEEIHVLQAENAIEVAGAYTEDSTYKDERQSAIMAEEYETATGQSIQEATDEELADWFTQKENSAEVEENTQSWTKEEAENYAFDQLIMLENLNYEKYFFFVNSMEEDWVQLEVREPVEQDGVTWSNLIGLYRFNVSTDELEKLDIVTGEYQSVQ